MKMVKFESAISSSSDFGFGHFSALFDSLSPNFNNNGLYLCVGIFLLFIYINRKIILSKPVLKIFQFIRIFVEDCFLFVFTAAWMILVGLPYSTCHLYKCILHIYMKLKYGPLGSTIDCLDIVGIFEKEVSSVNITSMKIMQGKCDLTNFRSRVEATVGKRDSKGCLVYPKFYQYLDQVSGYSCWKPSNFLIDHHVRIFDGIDQNQRLNETEVLDLISSISNREFQPCRSPWEILILPNFIYDHETQTLNNNTSDIDRKFGIVIRIHHAIGDGYSLLKLILRDTILPGEKENCAVPEPPKRSNMPLWKGFLVFLYMSLKSPRAMYREVFASDENLLFKNGRVISGKTLLVWSQPINIEFMKEIKSKMGVGLSTTFLTALMISVRKYIIEEFDKPPVTMSAVIPMPAPNHPDNKMTNKFSFVHYRLPCTEDDPKKSLELINREGQKLARAPDGPMNLFFVRLMGVLPNWCIRNFLRNNHSTVVVSNLPGPSEEISIWGSQLIDTMFWLPSLGDSGISASFLSYKNHFRIGLTVDTGIIQDGRTGAHRLLDGFVEAILIMAKKANVSSDQAFVQLTNIADSSKLTLAPRVISNVSDSDDSEVLSDHEGDTSGHYSFTSSDFDSGTGGSGDEDARHANSDKYWNPLERLSQRKRSFSSSSFVQSVAKMPALVEDEGRTLIRCNSVNSVRHCRQDWSKINHRIFIPNSTWA